MSYTGDVTVISLLKLRLFGYFLLGIISEFEIAYSYIRLYCIDMYRYI